MISIRSFIAIEIPLSLRTSLAELPRQADEMPSSVRWMPPESIHLTLKFLGNICPEQKNPIADGMKEAAKDIEPFSSQLTGVGAFPNENRPRVIWMGVRDDSGMLLRLQKNLEKKLRRLGFPKEGKKFTPHLTLGRVRTSAGKGAPLGPWISSLRNVDVCKGESASFLVDRFYLMRSELRPSGAVYSVLEDVLFPEGVDKGFPQS